MSQLTPAQLELIRTKPQGTRLDLFIFQPRIIFQAQVNDSGITKGARTITFDSVSLGNYAAIEANFTLLIGTTAGADDVGRIRIRSATSSTIVVSENSNIAWADNLHLTVLRLVDLWPIYPRIVQEGDPENPSFYKDYNIGYAGQNTILGTFPCAGPHRPVLLNGGTAQVWWSSTGTYNVKGDSLTYDWSFEGGTPTGSTSAHPGYVTYNTPGNYVTRLIVTSSSGAVDTTYRYVAVRNKIGEGSNTPVVRWTMDDVSGSRGEGGYSTKFRLYDVTEIDDNAIVMLYSTDYYGSTQGSLGGNYPNSSNIFFVGVIDKDSIHYNYTYSYVEFEVTSLTGLMKNSVGFSVSVESKPNPAYWYELLDMDVRRALYHYLRWHSTVLNMNDFQFVGQDYPIQYFDADRTSMFDAIDNLMRGTLVGEVVSDRQGKIWAEVTAKAYPNPTGSFPSRFDISNRDWMREPKIEENRYDQQSYLEFGGIAYSGIVTGTFAALLACAPGNAPSFRGKIERQQGLALGGQSQLNQMVGNVYANQNSRYPNIDMDMSENARNLDIAPQESSRITVQPSDTVRNISLDGLYIPDGIAWRYDAQHGVMVPRTTFRNLVSGVTGESIIIPAAPDDGTGGVNLVSAGFNVPSLRIPPLPGLLFPSTLGNRPIWKGQSTITLLGAILTSTITFEGYSTIYNVGGSNFGTATGTYIYPTLLVPGVYLAVAQIRLNTKSDFTSGIGGLTRNPPASEQEFQRFAFPAHANGTDYIHISSSFLCAAGDTIHLTFGWVRTGGADSSAIATLTLMLASG